MSGEIATGAVTRTKTYAKRFHENVGACNCLWADVDVKPNDGNAYETKAKLSKAFQQFLLSSHLPFPNLIVRSGRGGLHLYWLFARLLTPDEWRPFAQALVNAAEAHGFKIDAVCTTDICRLLRIPGTENFKTDPPLPVTLAYDDGETYTVEALQQALEPYWGKGARGGRAGGSTHGSKPGSKSGGINDDLSGGMKRAYPPANIDEVAKHCPFVADTLAAGGKNLVDDHQWHAVVALSCHCDDPSKTAHRLCEKNQHYDYDGCEAKLMEAQNSGTHTHASGRRSANTSSGWARPSARLVRTSHFAPPRSAWVFLPRRQLLP